MAASIDNIKELRELTGCGVMDCKKALDEASGDFEKAKELLQKRGAELAAKKSGRIAKEGRIEAYIHMGSKIGVMVEVCCETDFVARNEDLCLFAKNVAMHIAAMAPKYVTKEDIPEDDFVDVEDRDVFIKEKCLMEQPFVKDSSKTVQQCLETLVGKIGENIYINRFIRYKVGVVD